jgi:hypothetical protein
MDTGGGHLTETQVSYCGKRKSENGGLLNLKHEQPLLKTLTRRVVLGEV